MKIDLFSAAATLESTAKTHKVATDAAEGEGAQGTASTSYAEDTTSLTSAKSSVQSLTSAALATDPARALKVESLKQAVSEGRYSLKPEEIASALSSAKV